MPVEGAFVYDGMDEIELDLGDAKGGRPLCSPWCKLVEKMDDVLSDWHVGDDLPLYVVSWYG